MTLQQTNPEAGFGFGLATGDVNGDGIADVVAGSVLAKAGGRNASGQAFVFFGGSSPHTIPDLVLQAPNPEAGARFGWSIAVGDVNGDGQGDIIVSALFANGGENNGTGDAYVFFGGSLLDNQADLTLQHPTLNAKAHFGWSIAAGDINGDGIDDVIVGTENARIGNDPQAGQVFVYQGSRSFTGALTNTLQSPNPQRGGAFGYAVAVGRINADRFADMIVGAPTEDVGRVNNAGRVHIFLGGLLFDTTADATLQQPTPLVNSGFGQALAAGDVTGDLIEDLIVGTPHPNFVQTLFSASSNPGEVYVFLGGIALGGPILKIQAPSPARNDGFGQTLAVGDANGDGSKDLLIGMPAARVNNRANAGQVFLFLGGINLNATADVTLQEPVPVANAQFGLTLALTDVNGDRRADAVISSPESPLGFLGIGGGEGKILVFL
jgi:hypothetical protein